MLPLLFLQASSAVLAWLLHTLVLRIMMAMLGIGSVVPFLELVSYAGYAFVPACGSLLAAMTLGEGPGARQKHTANIQVLPA